MRMLAAVLVIGVVAGGALADEKALRKYDGQIVISPDPAPSTLAELEAHVKANATKDRRYELIKGPPWEVNLIGFLSKDPGRAAVTLVFTDVADKLQTPIQAIEVPSKRRLVIAKTTATTAAGFEENKTYLVRLVLGEGKKATTLARAELKLRN